LGDGRADSEVEGVVEEDERPIAGMLDCRRQVEPYLRVGVESVDEDEVKRLTRLSGCGVYAGGGWLGDLREAPSVQSQAEGQTRQRVNAPDVPVPSISVQRRRDHQGRPAPRGADLEHAPGLATAN